MDWTQVVPPIMSAIAVMILTYMAGKVRMITDLPARMDRLEAETRRENMTTRAEVRKLTEKVESRG